jgi:uncharacterized protein (TIGR00369 family)
MATRHARFPARGEKRTKAETNTNGRDCCNGPRCSLDGDARMDDIKQKWSTSSGLEFLEAIAAGRVPLFAQLGTLGIELLSVRPGHVELGWRPTPAMCNASGAAVHGGYIAMVLDDAAGLSCASLTERLWPLFTLELRLDYFRPVQPGRDYRIISDVMHRGSSRFVADARLLQAEGELLARACGSFVPNQRFDPTQEPT